MSRRWAYSAHIVSGSSDGVVSATRPARWTDELTWPRAVMWIFRPAVAMPPRAAR
jgi:hypothetical protein